MLRPLLFAVILFVGIAHAGEKSPPAKAPLRVLMLVPSDLMLPWALTQTENTRSAISAAVPGRVDFFAEGLDGLRFPGVGYENEFVALIRKRYADAPPDLIVVHGPMEGFVTRQRAALWPGTPWMAASLFQFAGSSQVSSYPEGVPGTTVAVDPAATIEIALKLQPDAKRIVVVGGSSEFDHAEFRRASDRLAPLRERLDIQFMVDLPLAEMERRLAALPRDSIVFHLPIQRVPSGENLRPLEFAAHLAKVASAPSYSNYDTVVGVGLIGGATANWAGQKPMIGRIARELLLGEPRQSSLVMHPPAPPVCMVDWRQLKHWNIPVDRLPPGCDVRFREPTLWEQFHREVLVILAVLLIQSALIIALVLQRRRRHRVQLELLEQRAQLAHAMRLATVGELSASIAHEINQPLAAILSNAEAGESLIESGGDAEKKLKDLHEILSAIREDDLRASEVIERMRRLLRNEPVAMRALNVNEAVLSIVRLARGAALRNGVTVQSTLEPSIPLVKGDYVQIQQVLLNLILNAIEAVNEAAPERRRVEITTRERPAGSVEVEVKDGGPGIAEEKLVRIFEPFFTTKPNGMGLGLSISRSIVQAHRGRIWAESDATGATFRFIIPG